MLENFQKQQVKHYHYNHNIPQNQKFKSIYFPILLHMNHTASKVDLCVHVNT
ncbi:hypothetical protein TTHERM_01433600 (macronuclear) [Tetrahymena thermophila SB210]|uniref:Uncharacterized protein n=1 Tax=Tetrahymena thermophila (strain SB210) TaxID=312017 RepID=Q235U5_TETTS|nr:hypothetical protein TTHERM_01433600 [Tetrahymena thermophila SB210]EAR92303.1 hypothetical protein TTHERM_01433600 [Tetrahymena thermophila SB210]|eukprot:XP_001012548.1 hypothetical protein TTHERM_01433600 [Tetrahymena thermophila SB210]